MMHVCRLNLRDLIFTLVFTDVSSSSFSSDYYHWGTNVVVKCLTLLLRIREILVSNVGPDTGYPKVFCGFLQPLQANAVTVP
jgi:hypothetical protein